VILDVGHGNSALIREPNQVTLVDAAPGRTVIEALGELGLTTVNNIVISHADADHCGGLVGLLLDEGLTVENVMLNADAVKESRSWHEVRVALRDASRRAKTKILLGVTSETLLSGHIEFRFEVLAPEPSLAAGGPGSTDDKGRRLTSNSMSAVIRIWRKGIPLALFPGDIDGIGLEHLLEDHPSCEARILVFPHHGGSPGSNVDARSFASRLCRAVMPQIVVFSLGRDKFGTPQPAIIDGVREAVPNAHIVCTQLSTRCAAALPAAAGDHLSRRSSKGAFRNVSCGGTLVFDADSPALLSQPTAKGHTDFVTASAPTALCRKR
jgi:competence protein ComEC